MILASIHQNASGELREAGAAYRLNTNSNASGRNTPLIAVYENHPQDSRITETDGVAPTVHSKYGTGGGNAPLVLEGKSHSTGTFQGGSEECPIVLDRAAFNQGENALYDPEIREADTMPTLVARGPHAVLPPVTARMVAFGEYEDDGTASTMKSRDYKDATDLVAHTLRGEGFDASEDGTGRGTPLVTAMRWREGKEGGGKGGLFYDGHVGTLATNNDLTLFQGSAVRRLTPVECERLQGFPDGWTQIPWNRKPASECPDGRRYKSLGNSMSTNVMGWIGERIEWVEEILRPDE